MEDFPQDTPTPKTKRVWTEEERLRRMQGYAERKQKKLDRARKLRERKQENDRMRDSDPVAPSSGAGGDTGGDPPGGAASGAAGSDRAGRGSYLGSRPMGSSNRRKPHKLTAPVARRQMAKILIYFRSGKDQAARYLTDHPKAERILTYDPMRQQEADDDVDLVFSVYEDEARDWMTRFRWLVLLWFGLKTLFGGGRWIKRPGGGSNGNGRPEEARRV